MSADLLLGGTGPQRLLLVRGMAAVRGGRWSAQFGRSLSGNVKAGRKRSYIGTTCVKENELLLLWDDAQFTQSIYQSLHVHVA